MHPAAFEYVCRVVQSLPPLYSVVEFGSRVVNGTVREIFTDAKVYLGIDIEAGPGVDIVADAADWKADEPVDCVVCCEVLEHSERWPEVVGSSYRALKPGGVLILTCASEKRAPHGVSGDLIREGEHYQGLEIINLTNWILTIDFSVVLIDPNSPPEDIYTLALKPR